MKNKPYPLYSLPQIESLRELIENHATNIPDEIAFSYKLGKSETVQKTYGDFNSDVAALGSFLAHHNIQHMHIGIIGENSYEWIVAFSAVTCGGGVSVPIDKELSSENISHLLEQSDCYSVFVSKKCLNLVKQIKGITVFDLSDFDTFVSEGKEYAENGETGYTNHIIKPNDLSAIFFTSGTTGTSKGVMLSHRNIATDINFACKNVTLSKVSVAVLPFHHTFGLITAVFKALNWRQHVYINQGLKHLPSDLQYMKPQNLFVVPLFVETFYKNIMMNVQKNKKTTVLERTMKISNLLLRVGIDLRRKLFKYILNGLGGNLEVIICGGAPLNTKYVKAFRSWGITVLNGYGITECSPVVSVNRNFYWRDESVGQILDGCLIKIADDGEILVKGDNVMVGYYKDEQATNEAMLDGWYHTGDLGHIDEDNFLYISGRKKNLIILSNGENISPEEIEMKILSDSAVAEVVVYGKDGTLWAEIFPAESYISNQEYFDTLIEQLNLDQPQYKRIQKVLLRANEFEKNSTMKILRLKISEDSHD